MYDDVRTSSIRERDKLQNEYHCALPSVNIHLSIMDISSSTGVFADQLFKQITSSSDTNVLISPVGILTILSMLLAGSGGKTRQQLRDVLQLESDVTSETVDDYNSRLIKAYNSVARSPNQLLMDNMMLVAKGRVCGRRGILQEYEDTVTCKYEASLKRVNFKKSGPYIQYLVNKWINDTTDGLISKALSSPPPVDTYLMLINVIYFNYQWTNRFQASSVNRFFVNRENAVEANFMMVETSLRYLRTSCKSDSQLQLIQIPYTGDFSMILMLPSVNSSLEEVLYKESLSNLVSMLTRKGRSRNIQLHMPKFKFDSRKSLIQPLEALGVHNLFNKPADLSGINGEQNLYVSSLEQVTAIEVNEIGTKAAAVTIAGVKSLAITVPRSPKVIIANRPFAFLIHDDVRNLPLFIGRLATP